MSKAIVSLSGGMDSLTVLAAAIESGAEVQGAVFRYGSKHNQFENQAAFAIAKHYNIPTRLFDLSAIMSGFRSNLMLTGGTIPEGHYEAESMRQTVVPGRNTIFASILMGLAESERADEVWLGIHAGDRAIYPDCRPSWIAAMNEVAETATEGTVKFKAPFLYETKLGILKYGLQRKAPYHLSRTCYKNQPIACGRCGSCQERLAAWKELGLDDPIGYESREPLPK